MNSPKQRRLPPATEMQAATQWWRSLPGGKKKYLKEHCKLRDDVAITRYWLARISSTGSN